MGEGASTPEAGSSHRVKRPLFNSVTSVLADVEDSLMEQRRIELLTHGEHLSLLCCGESGCGKTSLLNSLFAQKIAYAPPTAPTEGLIEVKSQIDVGALNLRLTTIDTPGYGDTMHLGESFERVTDYISQSFRNAIERERRPDRPGIDVLDESVGVDAVLYFVAPHRLKEVDIAFIRRLHTLATIVPIISKADVYTRDELRAFREAVSRRLHSEGIDIPCEPFAVISAEYPRNEHDDTPEVPGRVYPWGTALSECDDYSDLPALRKFLITEGLMDLHHRRRKFYENFRTNISIYRMELAEGVTSKALRIGKFAAIWSFRVCVVLFAANLLQQKGDSGGGTRALKNGDDDEEGRKDSRSSDGVFSLFRR